LTYNHMRERTLVLSFLMFKVISIFVLKLSKFLNPKAYRLISLMSLLVASSLALE
jgi:sortase A